MAIARKSRISTEHLEVADQISSWSSKYKVTNDPYVSGLVADLREEKNLAMWATLDPLAYLPEPAISEGYSAIKWTRLLTVLRNVLVFAPVALTWYAVGQATTAFSKYVGIHGTDVVNFLDFWQNGYDTLAKEWTIGRVATLDFLIIFLVIALTLSVSILGKRGSVLQEANENEIDRERVRVAVLIAGYLFDKKSVTNLTMNQSMANVLNKLLNASGDLAATAKSLEKTTKKFPVAKPEFDFDLYATPTRVTRTSRTTKKLK
jgi:hypothetical protein